nr:hypothetical protein [Tanacetum cinerariifolium]
MSFDIQSLRCWFSFDNENSRSSRLAADSYSKVVRGGDLRSKSTRLHKDSIVLKVKTIIPYHSKKVLLTMTQR